MGSRYVKSGGSFVELGGGGDPIPGPIAMAITGTTAFDAGWVSYVPFVPLRDCVVDTIGFAVATQSGNVDVGIYSDSSGSPGSRLASSGSVACPAAGARTLTFSEVSLTGGTLYWVAMSMSSATASFRYIGAGAGFYQPSTDTTPMGRRVASGGHPLASTAPASANVNNVLLLWVDHS